MPCSSQASPSSTVTPASVRICRISSCLSDSKSWLPSTAAVGSRTAASSFASTRASSGQAVVGQVAGQQQHLCRFGDPRKQAPGMRPVTSGRSAGPQPPRRARPPQPYRVSSASRVEPTGSQAGRESGGRIAAKSGMRGPSRAELSRMLATPLVTIGRSAAILVWEFENVGSGPPRRSSRSAPSEPPSWSPPGLRGRILKLSRTTTKRCWPRPTSSRGARSRQAGSRTSFSRPCRTSSGRRSTPFSAGRGSSPAGKLNEAQTVSGDRRDRARRLGAVAPDRKPAGCLANRRGQAARGAAADDGRADRRGRDRRGPAVSRTEAVASRRASTRRSGRGLGRSQPPAPDRLAPGLERRQVHAGRWTRHRHASIPPGDTLRLSVRDTGVGFPPETAHAAVRAVPAGRKRHDAAVRRARARPRHRAPSRRAARRHDHRAKRGPTSRAEFEVRTAHTAAEDVHLADTRSPSNRRRSSAACRSSSSTTTRTIASSCARASNTTGPSCATAASAHEARERFRRDRPDVLVSDLVMPDEDGLELIRQIRAMDERAGRLTPAAALSALARADDRRRALKAGYQMHVTKPIDPLELALMIERLAAARLREAHHV